MSEKNVFIFSNVNGVEEAMKFAENKKAILLSSRLNEDNLNWIVENILSNLSSVVVVAPSVSGFIDYVGIHPKGGLVIERVVEAGEC